MTENAKNSAAQATIQDPPEYNAETATNPKEGSDYAGVDEGNVKEKPSGADYTKHRFNQTPSESTEGAYQQNGQSWLGGPQNGNETFGHETEGAYQQNGQQWLGGPQNGSEIPGKSTEGAYQQNGQSWLGGPQNGDQTPSEAGTNAGNGGNGAEGQAFIGGPQDV